MPANKNLDPDPLRAAATDAEARFSGLVQLASDAIISIDASQTITFFNRGAEIIFGWAAEEVVGGPLDRLLPPSARAGHGEHVRRFGESPIRARRMGERQAISGLRRDGEEFPAEASIVKVEVPEGFAYTVVLRDVSEQHRAREQQRFLLEVGQLLAASLDLETTLSSVAEAAVGFLADYCIVDLVEDDGEVRRIRVASHRSADAEAALRLQEVELDRARRHLVSRVLDDGSSELVPRMLPVHLDDVAQNEPHRAVLERIGLNSYMAVPLRTRQGVLGALLLLAGPGRRRFDEQDLELAEEVGLRAGMAVENARLYRDARRAIQERDDILGVVSHDLGNPLQAVFIGVEALERRLREGSEGAAYYLSAIRRSAGMMQRLIQELLEVRRAEEGHLSLTRRDCRIPALVEEALEVIGPLARVKSVTLRNEVEGGQIPSLDIDGDRILQVLSNLIGNAVKHTPEGGEVRISAALTGGEIRVSVSDTGPGISEEDRRHVFERFWRAQRAGGTGLGLGLAIARGIVQAHGGRIWVGSEETGGSTFHFTLPLAV
jgi:PAS domain S-box-containing protein